jgi:hypothetical protein
MVIPTAGPLLYGNVKLGPANARTIAWVLEDGRDPHSDSSAAGLVQAEVGLNSTEIVTQFVRTDAGLNSGDLSGDLSGQTYLASYTFLVPK